MSKGPLACSEADPPNLLIDALDGAAAATRSHLDRLRRNIAYGRRLAREVARTKPDVVVSADTPLDSQAIVARECRTRGVGFVYWLQDIHAPGTDRAWRRRLLLIGAALATRYRRLERRLLREADAVIAVSADFLPALDAWGVARAQVEVVENWAPLADMPVRPRENAWSATHGLDGKLVFLYSGTLDAKHHPALLLALAHRMAERPDARVVVVSEGAGADWLAVQKAALPADNLLLIPFQPFERMPDVLAAADVLIATLEPEAGVYSVPSKVLTYLCAARPILAALPAENLAARILTRAAAGLVTAPEDEGAFCAAAERLAADPALRARLGAAGRAHVESHLRIEEIAARFERLCGRVAASYLERMTIPHPSIESRERTRGTA
jgi:glycosyltransferase involved in cell wall biosynthesis